MIKKNTNKSITWVDVENPTVEEIRSLMEEFNLTPSVARELQLPTYKQKISFYDDYLYMVMHFSAFRHSHNGGEDQEIDFVVGKNFIITVRYEQIDALERFSKNFEINNILDKGIMEDNAGYVLYYIIKELYKAMSDEIDSIKDSLKLIENKIFKGEEKEMVTEISKTNHKLININSTTLSHKEVLESLEKSGERLFGANFSENFSKILNEYYRIESSLKSDIELLSGIRGTNDSLLSSKQNGTMKILTIITFLALPFSVITGFFQMNTKNTPFIGSSYDWQIVVFTEIIVVMFLFFLVKFKKWM
ncbi:MAG: CorA family divalent cation transporter [Candidatus Pacebacteria bacterium]|nr:CorA family divalent cation transporter [Candidatus Paceibacterota bacterium]